MRRIITRNNLIIETTDFIGLGAESVSLAWRDIAARFPPVDRLLEMGAGAGMTGLELLADGFCQRLWLSDLVPECVEQCRINVALNHREGSVTAILSDVWDGFADEQFDFVIFHMPTNQILPPDVPATRNPHRWLDPDMATRTRVFDGAKNHIARAGHLVIVDRPDRATEMPGSQMRFLDRVPVHDGARDFLIFERENINEQ